jgi:alpha-galactosidase
VQEWHGLDPEKELIWKKWFALYNQYRLSEGEYLNLYDLAYDLPEGHAIRKGDHLFYAFYAVQADDPFQGTVELRGLEERSYRLTDYVNGRNLGTIEGPTATLTASFAGSLLIEAVPEGD